MPLIFGCVIPAAPPVNPPLTLGALQLYTIPDGTIPFVPLIGLTVKATPLQLTELIAVITGVGLIVTVNTNDAPVHAPDTGVTVYVAICAIFVGFVRLPVISIAPVPLMPPVIPPVTTGTLQLYNVPPGTIPSARFVGLTVNITPLQLTAVRLLITAVGLIVIVTVNVAPVQLPDIGLCASWCSTC